MIVSLGESLPSTLEEVSAASPSKVWTEASLKVSETVPSWPCAEGWESQLAKELPPLPPAAKVQPKKKAAEPQELATFEETSAVPAESNAAVQEAVANSNGPDGPTADVAEGQSPRSPGLAAVVVEDEPILGASERSGSSNSRNSKSAPLFPISEVSESSRGAAESNGKLRWTSRCSWRLSDRMSACLLRGLWLTAVGLSIGTLVLELVGVSDRLPKQITSVLTSTATVALGIVFLFRTTPAEAGAQPTGTPGTVAISVAEIPENQEVGKKFSLRTGTGSSSVLSANSRGSPRSPRAVRKGAIGKVREDAEAAGKLLRQSTSQSELSESSYNDYNRKHGRPSLTSLGTWDGASEPSLTGSQDATPIVLEFDIGSFLPHRSPQKHKVESDSIEGAGKTVQSVCDVVVGHRKGESVSAEIMDIDDGQSGSRRVRVAFSSHCLRSQSEWQKKLFSQQKNLLNAVSTELMVAQQALAQQDEDRAEQKELLRGFRKVITRESADAATVESSKTVVFVFEEEPKLRAELVELCELLEYDCHPYTDLEAGILAFREMVVPPQVVTSADIHNKDPKKRWQAVRQAAMGIKPGDQRGSAFGATVLAAVKAAKHKELLVRVILIGTSMFTQLRSEWDAENAFVVLVSRAEEFEEVGRYLSASGEKEVREKLLTHFSVREYLLYPLSLDALRGLMSAAVRHRFAEEYLLLEQIGRGSFGIVHRAKRIRDLSVFALKEISSRRMNKKEKASVVSEMDILREVRWPTVLYLVDAWTNTQDKIHFLLMPLLDGGNLDDFLKKIGNTTGLEQIFNWFSQTVHGLAYLHWQGILHRDLKPANLVLATNGVRLRIGDFGSALRVPGSGPHPSSADKVKGTMTTPDYAPPEMVDPGYSYPSSDMWSLGKTFIEVLAVNQASIERCKSGITRDRSPSRGEDLSPAPNQVASFETTEEEFSTLLEEMSRAEPVERPTAATLMARPSLWDPVKIALKEDFEEPELWEAHFKKLKQILNESEKASRSGGSEPLPSDAEFSPQVSGDTCPSDATEKHPYTSEQDPRISSILEARDDS